MLFNSIDFAIFFPLFFICYWLISHRFKLQNTVILIASYIFYGWWDWRFLILIFASTLIDFIAGKRIEKTKLIRYRKAWLFVSLTANLGTLGFFKYYNFFIENFISSFSFLGFELSGGHLNIILPVGISFYTFQTLSYTIDIYRNKFRATEDFLSFASFVSYFPQLVAGPIERASHLLPQFHKKRSFNYGQSVDGLRQILWGFFKKMVIADNCANYVDIIFNDPSGHSSLSLIIGAVFFTTQIYCDFSGYSDIAIGISKTLGIKLSKNFAFPFFSRDMAEFWRRWHISLSTWFRDYLYIPLGGSKTSKIYQVRNTMIVFIVSGFWHGANWTFIIWGVLNAVYFLPLLLGGNNRKYIDNISTDSPLPSVREFVQIISTFSLTVFAFIFFRAADLSQAFNYISHIFNWNSLVSLQIENSKSASLIGVLVIFLITVEWLGRHSEHALEAILLKKSRWSRWSFYISIIFLIGMFMETSETPFIYFQF